MSRYRKKYWEEVVPALTKEFNYTSNMQVPRISKVVINSAVGEAVINPKVMDFVVYAMTQVAGQKPIVTKAKKSIAAFKLREGMPIGCKVTLRSSRMFDFIDRLVSTALPRTRDFKGISPKGFDGRGNYTFGIKEQIVFPEINMDKIDKIRGFDITFVTTSKSDDESKKLLELMGLPFRKN